MMNATIEKNMDATAKIIEKIQNLLDLASNNPNENEALAAALKAQELMAKYNINLDEVKHEEEEIIEISYDGSRTLNQKFKRILANVIARNFCCKNYTVTSHGSGDVCKVVFMGHKHDAEIAMSVFKYLCETGMKLANNYYMKHYSNGTNTRNLKLNYLYGFTQGVDSVLSAQCVALMIVTPKDVEDKYEEMSKGFSTRTIRIRNSWNSANAQADGYASGRSVAQARELEG